MPMQYTNTIALSDMLLNFKKIVRNQTLNKIGKC